MKTNLEKLAFEWASAVPESVDVENEYYCQTRDVFQQRHLRMLNELLETKHISDEDAYVVSAIIGEIGNNSFDHNLGNWRDVPGVFFGYEIDENGSNFAVVDRGQGVLETLKKAKPELQNDRDAVIVAFTERISGRAPEARGNGLKFVRENVLGKKMRLLFISGNAKAELNDKFEVNKSDKEIKGCLALLKYKQSL